MMEDDLFFARAIRGLLEAEGWEVKHTINGEEGMATLKENRPDLLLLDVTLPRKNGFEVLDEMAADAGTRHIPVIMLTELAAREDVERCFAFGVCEYLIKSHVTPLEIVSRIRGRLAQTASGGGGGFSSGSVLAECLMGIGVLVLSGVFAYWQYGTLQTRAYGAWQLSTIRLIQSSLVAAGQEALTFAGCAAGDPLAQCRICEGAACANDRSKQYLPASLFASDGGETCRAASRNRCRWSVEQDGGAPLKPGQVRVRFFLEKELDGMTGGRTYVVFSDGSVD